MTDHRGSVIESQVDWITCSAHGEDPARALLDLGQQLAKEEKARGGHTSRWRCMGYEGTHVGRVEYGSRDKASTILRLSGQLAGEEWTDALSVADQVTRLDIAVTWRADPPDPMLGRNAYTLAEMFHSAHPRFSLPSFHGDAVGGYTMYLGKRASDYYLRLYNKEAESIAADDKESAERYRACWRYELEVKGHMAKALADTLADQDDQPLWVQQYIYQWCRAHGVEPAFGEFGPRRLLPGFRRRSDDDSKLQHLRKNVRPTVDRLRQNGREHDLRDALGFDATADLLRQLEGILARDKRK